MSKKTGLDRATVQRLFIAMEATGWIHRNAAGKRFYAGHSESLLLPIARMRFPPPSEFLHAAVPAMRQIAKHLGDAVFLVARDGTESVGVHREIGSYPVQILATFPGQRHPLGVGSAGMALLAAMSHEEAQQIVLKNAPRLVEYGGLSQEMILRLRASACERGYAVMRNYAVSGVLGVGSALCMPDGSPILAMSVSSVADRMPVKRQAEVANLLQRALCSMADTLDSRRRSRS